MKIDEKCPKCGGQTWGLYDKSPICGAFLPRLKMAGVNPELIGVDVLSCEGEDEDESGSSEED